MKKIIFLAVIAIVFSASNLVSAQQKITLPCGDSLLVKTTIEGGAPIVELQKDKKKKGNYTPSKPGIVYHVNIVNSNNTTYPQIQQHSGCGQGGSYECVDGHANFTYDDVIASIFGTIILLALLLGFAVWLVYRYRRNYPNTPASPVTVHVPPAPTAPSPVVVVPPSLDEVDKAMDKAASSGGKFMRSKDGSYTVDFPKPAVENKTAEKKESAQ